MKGDKWICIDDFLGMNDIEIRKGFILTEGDDDYMYFKNEIICGLKSYNAKQCLDKVEK